MTDLRPLTSQEIDDGWCLDEVVPSPPIPQDGTPYDAQPYEELILEEERPKNGIEQAYWELREGKKLKHRYDDTPKDFGNRRGPRAERRPAG